MLEDDFLEQIFVANTHDYLLFASSAGKAYWLKVHEISEASRQARGVHIKSLLAISPNEEITTVVDLKEFSEREFLFMGTLRGVVKKVATKDFVNAKTRGIIAINLDEGDKLVSACRTGGDDEVMLITRRGQALRITEKDVRVMGRASHGVTGIRLSDSDELCAMLPVREGECMLILSEYGYGKRVRFEEYLSHGRATRGQKIYDPEEKTGELVGAITVNEENEVVVMTSLGKTLKFPAASVSIQGRGAHGVRVVNIDTPDFVIGLDRIVQEEADAPKEEPEPESEGPDAPEE